LVSCLVWLLRLWVAVCCMGMGCILIGCCWSMIVGALNRLIVVLIPAHLLITCRLISLLSLLLVVRSLHCRLGISHLGLTISLLVLLVNWLWRSIHRRGLLVCLGLRSGVSLTIVRLLRLGITLLWLAIAGLGLAIASLRLSVGLLGLSLISGGSLVVALMVQSVAKTESGTVEGRAETKAKTVTIAAPEGTISSITTTKSALVGRAITVTVAAVSISTIAAITVFAVAEVTISSVVPWVEERPEVVVVAVVVSLSVAPVVLPGLLVLLTPPLVVVIVIIMVVLAPALVPVILVLVYFALVMPLVVLTMVSLAVSPVFAKMAAAVVSGVQVGSVVKGQWQQVIASVVVAYTPIATISAVSSITTIPSITVSTITISASRRGR